MARSRNIKPSFFTNDELIELPAMTRLLFIGLWTIADKAGRIIDRPKKIKLEVLPGDDCDCEPMLKSLADRGFILRYEVQGSKYIQIVNFGKHQNPHKKEAESVIPAPEFPVLVPVEPVIYPVEPGLNPLTDSLNLIPDPLIPPKPPKVEFEGWYSIYPHKIGRAAAEKAFPKARKSASLEDLFTGLQRYIRDKPPDREWCNPATWLNQQRWMDEPNEITGTSLGNSGRQPSKHDRARAALLRSAEKLGYADGQPGGSEATDQSSVSVF